MNPRMKTRKWTKMKRFLLRATSQRQKRNRYPLILPKMTGTMRTMMMPTTKNQLLCAQNSRPFSEKTKMTTKMTMKMIIHRKRKSLWMTSRWSRLTSNWPLSSRVAWMNEKVAKVCMTFISFSHEVLTLDVDNNAQREATYFKNRVLDLVDSYMKREPANELFLRLIVPLVTLISSTSSDERQLSDKANGILRSHMQKHKEKIFIVDTSSAVEILEDLHGKARKSSTPELLSTINLCSIFVCKCLSGKEDEAIAKAYQASIVDFATRKASSLQPPFIIDFIRKMPSIAWETRHTFVNLCDNPVNGFRQCQLFHMAQVLLASLPTIVRFRLPATPSSH